MPLPFPPLPRLSQICPPDALFASRWIHEWGNQKRLFCTKGMFLANSDFGFNFSVDSWVHGSPSVHKYVKLRQKSSVQYILANKTKKEKAKLSDPCLLWLKVSNRGGSHQALNIDTENCRQLSQCFPNQNGNSSRPRSPLVLAWASPCVGSLWRSQACPLL